MGAGASAATPRSNAAASIAAASDADMQAVLAALSAEDKAKVASALKKGTSDLSTGIQQGFNRLADALEMQLMAAPSTDLHEDFHELRALGLQRRKLQMQLEINKLEQQLNTADATDTADTTVVD